MAAVDEFRSGHVSVASDSLGGAAIGRVISYEWFITTNAGPSYALGSVNPYVIGEGNRAYGGTMTMVFRDLNELLTLIAADPQIADTHFVRYSNAVSSTETVDVTLSGIKYESATPTSSNDGGIVQATYPFHATTLVVAETTVA